MSRNEGQSHGPEKKWEEALNDAINLSFTALGAGVSCVCVGAYVTQNSYASTPAMLGLILMVLGIDAVLNAFLVFMYIKLIARSDTTLLYLTDNANEFVIRTSRVLSVPASSLVWCLLSTLVTVTCYTRQSGVPQIDLQTYMNGQNATSTHFAHHFIATPASPSTTTTSASLPVEDHAFPLHAQISVGMVTFLCAARILFVLFSILGLRSTSKTTRFESGLQD